MFSVYKRFGQVSNPPRAGDYTVASQPPAGYFHIYGPTTWNACAAYMRQLRVPGW
jgi:hypothetical protein